MQAQINLLTKDANYLKIFTIFQEICKIKEEVEKKASIHMIKKLATKKSCRIAMKEKYFTS